MFPLVGSLEYKYKDIESAGGFIFDFVDIEDQFVNDEKKNIDLIRWLKTLSTSLKQQNFEDSVERLKQNLSEAHNECKNFAVSMQEFNENTFVDQFTHQRPKVFNEFIHALKGANRCHLLNNFDLQNFSIPMEYSIENNFWCA